MTKQQPTLIEKTAFKCGNSAHIGLGKNATGKTFVLLPAHYKPLLAPFLKKMEAMPTPKLKDVLTSAERSRILHTIAHELQTPPTGFASALKHGALQSLATHLDDATDLEDIYSILGRTDDPNTRRKIRNAYHL